MTPEIDSRFRRLVEPSQHPGAIRLWNLLNRRERKGAALYFADDEVHGRKKLNEAVAVALRCRPQTVRRWPLEKIVQHMSVVPVHDPALAMELLIHSLGRPEDGKMVRRLFTGLGIPHGEKLIGPLAKHLDASRYSIRKVGNEVADKYGDRPVAICFLVLRLAGSPLGEKACDWLRERWSGAQPENGQPDGAAQDGPHAADDSGDGEQAAGDVQEAGQPAAGGAGEGDRLSPDAQEDQQAADAGQPDGGDASQPAAHTGPPQAEDEPQGPEPVAAPDVPEPPARQASLTTLDHLLKHALEDCVRGTLGALSEEEVNNAIDEFVKLNGTRHESYFHAGYRDVLFDRDLAKSVLLKHPGRLRWYWSGAVGAWAMRERWDRIAQEYDDNPVIAELASGSSAASAAAVLHIVEALRRADRAAEIGRALTYDSLLRAPTLFQRLLSAGTELLRDGDAVHARHLFELLIHVSGDLEERGIAPERRVLLDARRRFAHSLRALRDHGRARKVLKDLLADDPDANTHAMVHADLGLMAGGFDSLEDVELRTGGTAAVNVGDRLARGEDHFLQSVGEGTEYSAHGHYSLGVLALARGDDDEEAERHLNAAYMHFSKQAGSYGRLVPRSSLYAAIAKTRQLQSDKLAHAARLIVDALAQGARFPVHFASDTIDAFDLGNDQKSLRRVAEAIIDNGSDEVLDELASCTSALKYCPLLATRLHEQAGAEGRPSNTRSSYLRASLLGHMYAQSYGRAREALDELERLAREGVAVPAFNELLADPQKFDPAWTREDAAIARARCHEALDEYEDATSVLSRLFHRKASEDTEEGLHDAAGILERVAGYGIDKSFYQDMRSRHDALVQQSGALDPADSARRPPGADDSGQERIVRVLVVGGAEQQAKAENPVRRALRNSDPHIRATFVQTGWGSQWNRALSDFERHAYTHDAMVIMRFIRTNLGRQVRQMWPGDRPWRFCWSGGRGAIIETVRKVAALARDG